MFGKHPLDHPNITSAIVFGGAVRHSLTYAPLRQNSFSLRSVSRSKSSRRWQRKPTPNRESTILPQVASVAKTNRSWRRSTTTAGRSNRTPLRVNGARKTGSTKRRWRSTEPQKQSAQPWHRQNRIDAKPAKQQLPSKRTIGSTPAQKSSLAD